MKKLVGNQKNKNKKDEEPEVTKSTFTLPLSQAECIEFCRRNRELATKMRMERLNSK